MQHSAVNIQFKEKVAQPPTVVCKREAQLKYVPMAYTFLHIWHLLVCSDGATFLHRSLVGSLLRVRCWLGA